MNRPAVEHRRPYVLVGVVLLAGLAVVGWAAYRAHQSEPPAPPAAADSLTLPASPYRNTRPDVPYVGDAACAGCHPGQAETYRHHPMGRSFAPTARAADQDRYDASAHDPFDQFCVHYTVERRGDRVYHRAVRRGGGKVLYEHEEEVQFVVGSGSRGRSYLVNHDGFLFQSPISWFAQKQRWDLSPGYDPQLGFDRPIQPQCVFCHCNDARPVAYTVNRYEQPLFRQYAIGCERCHGPGELHARSRERAEAVGEPDLTIVNPRHLEPALREAVCEQCHLQGEARIVRRDRQPFDYRPGLPLQAFWSVFVRPPGSGGPNRAVSHVQQMHLSRCFLASDGKLGCVSCHDPHALPDPEKKVAYYRDRCLACHQERGCSLPSEVRRTQNAEDSCVACHMPRFPTADIVHTAGTDHRIPRRPGAAPERSEPAAATEVPLVAFHDTGSGAPDMDALRDLGLAIVEQIRKQGQTATTNTDLALPLLRPAVERWPDDLAAREAYGFVLWIGGRPGEGLSALENVLARAPDHELALVQAATIARKLKQMEKAEAYWKRALAVNPWSAAYHSYYAELLGGRGDWPGAVAECRAALRLNPARGETRFLLIQGLLRAGDRDQARAEFDTLLGLSDPAEEPRLRRWFERQSR